MKKKKSNNPRDEQRSQVREDAKEPAQVEEPIDEGDEINRLLDEGYSVKQIIALGFKRRTAYHYAKLRMQPENDPAGSAQGDGSSGGLAGKGKQELTKVGAKDVIPPEAILDVIHLPRNGDAVEVWRRGVLDGVGILLLGARYSQLTAAGQAEVIKNQLDILREARESGMEMAQQAATEAAAGVAARIMANIDQRFSQMQERKKDIAEVQDPMKGLIARTMESLMNRLTGQMLGGGQGGQELAGPTPGMVDKRGQQGG